MLPPERPQFSGSGVQTRGMRQHFMNAIAGFHVAYPGAIVIEHKKPKRRRKIAALLTLRIDGVNQASDKRHKSTCRQSPSVPPKTASSRLTLVL